MKSWKAWKAKHSNELTLLLILLGVFVLMSVLSPSKFLSPGNIQTMAFQMPEFGLMALGMMAAILTGGINLSITSVGALSGIVSAFVLSSPWAKTDPVLATLLAVVVCVAIAALTGLLNGFVIAYVGVAAMLTTLGTMTLFDGISLNLTKGSSIAGFPSLFIQIGNGSVGGIPIPILIYTVAVVAAYYILERSAWGIQVYMTGCNRIATSFSGINTKRTLLLVYVFSSVMAGLGGLIIISRYNSAKVDYGSSYMMNSVAAVVLGGTSINGGHGTVAGTVIAVAIIQMVSSGLNILGVNRYIVDIVIGVILIAVLAIRSLAGIYDRAKLLRKHTAS